jgi:hypothetical protein
MHTNPAVHSLSPAQLVRHWPFPSQVNPLHPFSGSTLAA